MRAAVLLLAIIVSGCSSIQMVVPDRYFTLTNAVPFRADRPIAREIRYTYMTVLVVNGRARDPLVATNIDARRAGPPGALVTPQATITHRMSSVYQSRANEARSHGDTQGAAFYSQLSESNLRVENSMQGSIETVNTAFSIYNGTFQALAGIAQASLHSSAEGLRRWVERNIGCVGPSAPPGSVLYLDFRYVNTGRSFHLDSRGDYIVTATLDMGNGVRLSSSQNFSVYTLTGDDPAPAGYVPPPPIRPESPLYPLRDEQWGPFLGMLANTAIMDLYAQLAVGPGSAPVAGGPTGPVSSVGPPPAP